MSGKNQVITTLNWQSANPQLTLFPLVANTSGSTPSGVLTGTMTATNTIYSNIIDISRMDNVGLDVSWTGTPVGTIKILVSDATSNTANWSALTFTFQQPAGVDGYEALSLNQVPFRFMMVTYTNTSSTGVLTINTQLKDLN